VDCIADFRSRPSLSRALPSTQWVLPDPPHKGGRCLPEFRALPNHAEGVETQTRAPGGPSRWKWERQMKRIYQVAFLWFLLVPPGPAVAVEKGLVNKGEVLVRENCSRCHAIGKEGHTHQRPPSAPYPANIRSRILPSRRGHCLWASGHAIFVFGPHDVEAIIEYLKSIQSKQP
jgi:cytochrome c